MSRQETTELFSQALDVWNHVLEKHGSREPYKTTIQACENRLGDTQVGVFLYETDPDQPTGTFTVRFLEGRIQAVDFDEAQGTVSWTVSEEYLRDVIANADDYLEHPEKLDWDWSRERAGMGA